MQGKGFFILMGISLLIAFAWEKIPIIKDTAHLLLDPTLGFLINWNALWGLLIIVFAINILITVIHKYSTDQDALKELREKSKDIQKQMREAQKEQDQKKVSELSKQSFAQMGDQFKHSFGSMGYTAVPLILFFRWFGDFFSALENPKLFFGIFGWFGTYLIASIIFSTFIRKILKVH